MISENRTAAGIDVEIFTECPQILPNLYDNLAPFIRNHFIMLSEKVLAVIKSG
jgi:hypothetical protein